MRNAECRITGSAGGLVGAEFPLTASPLPIGWGEGDHRLRFGLAVALSGADSFLSGWCSAGERMLLRTGKSALHDREELKEVGGVVLEEPVAEAALFPFGEVLFGDGAVVEVGGEDGFDFGERVEPGENGFGGEAIVEFEVELFAEVVREPTDFADMRSSVHMIYNFSFW